MNKKQINSNEKSWVTIEDASKRTPYSQRQIRKLIEIGIERIGSKKDKDGHILINKQDLLKYIAAHPHERPILCPTWDEITNIPGEVFYPLFGYDCKYFITNKNRVINASNGMIMTVQPPREKDGYRQVGLMKNGKLKTVYLHRLIGKTQCSNVLDKDDFHHIDKRKPLKDTANNILPVWKWQHDELHKLIKAGKNEEYKKMIAEIKKENRQKLYKIPHLDFENDQHNNYFMLVTSEGYKTYKRGEEISIYDIVKEWAEPKGRVLY